MVVPGGGSVWNGRGHVGWDGTGRGGGRTIGDLAGHAEVSPGDDARSSGDTASCCARREAEANAPQGAAQEPGRKRLGHGAAAVDVIVSFHTSHAG